MNDNHWMPLLGTALAVRMDLLTETWAQRNHYQSLAQLASRGGLSPCEALAVAEQRRYEHFEGLTTEGALKVLAQMRVRTY